MPRRSSAKGKGKAQEDGGSSDIPRTAFQDLFPPSGAVEPMCLCGDPCRLVYSYELPTWKRRYWKCRNYEFDPPEKARKLRQLSPPKLCEFRQWYDMEIDPEDQMRLDQEFRSREFRARLQEQRDAEREEARMKEAEEKEAERERKRERARRAREAPPEAWAKGKWPRCTQ